MRDAGRYTEEYKIWRRKVRLRDKNRCQWPNCKRKAAQVHHIVTYSSAPHLRYAVNNGICLCLKCHKSIKGKELQFVAMFMSIIEGKQK